MRILYHHRTRARDGQRIHIDGLVEALRRAGHEVVMVGPPLEDEGQAGRAIRRPAWQRPVREMLEVAYNGIEYRQLARAARTSRPDALYSRHALFGCAPRWVARRFRLPWVIEVNAPIAWERAHFGGLFWKAWARWLETRTLNAADHVIVVTEVLAGFLRKQGVRADRLVVLPNGVDPGRRSFAPPPLDEAKQGFGLQGRAVLGFVGFVRDWNRLDRTYGYLERHPEALLWVIGDGPDRERLLAEARRRSLADQVRIEGAVASEAVLQHVAAFDAALLPEATEYASPLKMLDYFAAGRAVLAPDRPNIREIARHGENAWLFDPDEEASFARRLDELMGRGDLRQRLGERARASIEEQGLTWDHNAERTVACLRRRSPAAAAP